MAICQRVTNERKHKVAASCALALLPPAAVRAAHLSSLSWVHARRGFALLIAAGAQVQEHVVGVHLQRRVLRRADLSSLQQQQSHATKLSYLRFGATKERQGAFDVAALQCEQKRRRGQQRTCAHRSGEHVARACAQTSMLRRDNAASFWFWLPCAARVARPRGEHKHSAGAEPPPDGSPPCCAAAACSGPWAWRRDGHGGVCPSARSSAPSLARRPTWRTEAPRRLQCSAQRR